MKSLFQKFFGRTTRKPIRNNKHVFRPQCEGLESRLVPTISFSPQTGTLAVYGSSAADEITFEETSVFSHYEFQQSNFGWIAFPVYVDHIQATRAVNGVVQEQSSQLASDVDKLYAYGNSGNDVITNDTAKPAEFKGSTGNDTLFGGTGNDTLEGGLHSDQVYGREGHDVLKADAQYASDSDLLSGGEGNDTFSFEHDYYQVGYDIRLDPFGNVSIMDNSGGNDTVDLSGMKSGANIRLNTNSWQTVNYLLDLRITPFSEIENVVGTPYDDNIIGNNLANQLGGGAGDDWIEGGAGNDTLTGGTGDDRYFFWTEANTIYNTNMYANVIFGGHGSNLGSDRVIEGSNQDSDWLDFAHFGASSIDLDLQTTANQNVASNLQIDLNSTTGIEKVTGTRFGDDIFGNSRANVIYGGDGNDDIHGRDGNDNLQGQDGDDTLRGGNGRDSLYGGNHNDQLFSDEFSGDNDGQDDYLNGGAGYDTGDDDGWWYYNPF